MVVSIVVYYIYTIFISDDFGVGSKTNIETAQNCIYYAVSIAAGYGSRQFEASSPFSRSLATVQLIGHFVLLRYALLAE